jgi:polysaccharide pyruvyl transferase WcaK-like protein
MHIGLFGHYGNENLGDEAIIEAALSSLGRHFPNAQISCFSSNPDDSARRHGVDSYPIRAIGKRQIENAAQGASNASLSAAALTPRPIVAALFGLKEKAKANAILGPPYRLAAWSLNAARAIRLELPFLLSSYRVLKKVDLLLISGSNQLADFFGGSWGYPYTLLKWTVLSRLTGTEVAIVSVGAGPVDFRLSKMFISTVLRMVEYVSFRDDGSRILIEKLIGQTKGLVFPDLARNLEIPELSRTDACGGKATVGINPMPIYDERYWYRKDELLYKRYVQVLAEFVAYLYRNQYPVFLFSTQKRDHAVIDDVVMALPDQSIARGIKRRYASTSVELVEVIRGADICVATRFHGVVLSLLAGVPVIGISYQAKTAEVLKEMGQGDFEIALEEVDVPALIERFHRLEQVIELSRKDIAVQGARTRQLLEDQYALLAAKFT